MNPRRLSPRRFSRPVPSAARPPLRINFIEIFFADGYSIEPLTFSLDLFYSHVWFEDVWDYYAAVFLLIVF